MKKDNKGKAQTVLGVVDGSELGITLPHEHLFVDLGCYALEPKDPEEKKLARQKVTLENLWYHRHNLFCGADNMVFDDEEMAIREATYFKEAGGRTFIDVTPIGVGRTPERLVRVAEATGLNIIMGTSYYVALSYTPSMKLDSRTEDDIAAEFIHDIKVGVGDSGIQCGIIGEIGCSWPLDNREKKVLRAAAIAQKETGAAITIHPGPAPEAPAEIISILKGAGADLNRAIIGHMTRTFPADAFKARARVCEQGCYIEEDWFGREGELPVSLVSHLDKVTDTNRINLLMALIKDGFLDRILISHDHCFKVMLRSYGGGGYGYILQFIVPEMLRKGMTQEQINTILVDNTRRIGTFV